MAVDPTQLQSEMSLDKSGDMTYTTPELTAINNKNKNKNKNINLSSNSINTSSAKPNVNINDMKSESNDKIIEFMDSPFSESLKRYIDIIGITANSINRFNPLISETSWTNMGRISKDIEDCSYLLLDNNRKLLRTGGLLNDEYISKVSICDLTNSMNKNKNMNTNNNHINWINLPQLNHKRHGHNTLCINVFNKPHIIAIGGFDSKGNTIAKSEIISLKQIQSSLQNQNNKSQQLINGRNNKGRNMNIGQWNIGQCMELSEGIADFGVCCDRINNRIYMCGGLNARFKSLSKCSMYDIKSNKFLNLPNLNYERHCNKCELLNTNNPNILITFGGWTGMARNTIEIIDLRNNINKWQININNNNNKNNNGYGIFNYPHACCTSIIKCIENGKNNNIDQQLNGLHINNKCESKSNNENVIIVCGHKEGLFIETNVIEAFELKTKTWHTIAKFKYSNNSNINQNLINAQQKTVPLNNNANININHYKKYNRFANAFRYLTLL